MYRRVVNSHVHCCRLLRFIALVTMQVANWVQVRLVLFAKLPAQLLGLQAP